MIITLGARQTEALNIQIEYAEWLLNDVPPQDEYDLMLAVIAELELDGNRLTVPDDVQPLWEALTERANLLDSLAEDSDNDSFTRRQHAADRDALTRLASRIVR